MSDGALLIELFFQVDRWVRTEGGGGVTCILAVTLHSFSMKKNQKFILFLRIQIFFNKKNKPILVKVIFRTYNLIQLIKIKLSLNLDVDKEDRI